MKSSISGAFGAVLCGGLIGAAFLCPERVVGTVFAAAFIILLCRLVPRARLLYRDLFLMGLVLHAVGFYWLPHTISFFGGFPSVVSYLLFALFCAVSSFQFVLLAFFYRALIKGPGALSFIALPLSWLCAEFLLPKMFPWALAHPFITWRSFAGLAEYVGIYPLGAALLLAGSLLVGHPRSKLSSAKRVGYALSLLTVLHLAGLFRARAVDLELASAPTVRVGLIQGNLEARTKGNVNYLASNIAQYQTLSARAAEQGAQLIIWPESVFNDWIPETTVNLQGTVLDPDPQNRAAMIYGGLSYRVPPGTPRARFEEQMLRFNAAFAVTSERRVQSRYYKRVLMPFGEYMPFADLVPAIKQLSPMTGEFTAGDIDRPLLLDIDSGQAPLKVGTLICYEDMLPSISRDLARQDADLFVNLTNDAWYGDTAAPRQHHLLALWRAIETRRYFVRATNTGYSAIVDPYGKTVQSLPLFQAAQLTRDVSLLSSRTVYSKMADAAAWAMAIVAALLMGLWRSRS